jgi:glycerophosphoryl diester phosphodiesterase
MAASESVMGVAGGFLDAPPPVAFAHRGYARDGDENSMAAFQRAVDLGYRYLETDVRTTRDGVALAFHDLRLDRVTDGHGLVAAQPWSAVRTARIAGREPIPLLLEVLDAWPQVRINLDVKSNAGIGPTVAAVATAGAWDRVCLTAFSDRRVAQARRCVQVPPRLGRLGLVDERFVSTAHAAGLPVHVWTVNERAEMERLLDLGVDGLMTDEAPLLREVLRERGQW